MFHDDKNPLEPEYTPFSQTQEERFNGFYETGNTRPPKTTAVGWRQRFWPAFSSAVSQEAPSS